MKEMVVEETFAVGDMVAARVKVEAKQQWAMMKVSQVVEVGTGKKARKEYVVVDLYPDSDDETTVHQVRSRNMLRFPPKPNTSLAQSSGTKIYALWYEASDWSTVFYPGYVDGPSSYGENWISVRYVGSRTLFDVPLDKVFRDPRPPRSATNKKKRDGERKSGRKRKQDDGGDDDGDHDEHDDQDDHDEGGEEEGKKPAKRAKPLSAAPGGSSGGSGSSGGGTGGKKKKKKKKKGGGGATDSAASSSSVPERPRMFTSGSSGGKGPTVVLGPGEGNSESENGGVDTAFALAMAREAEDALETGDGHGASRVTGVTYELGGVREELKLDSLLDARRVTYTLKKRDLKSVLHKKRALLKLRAGRS